MSSAPAEIGLCLLLSAADGEISDEELGALTSRVGQLLGDDFALSRLSALVDGELTSIAELGADDYVKQLPDRIPVERRLEAMTAACKIACADGLSPEEEEMLRLAATALGVEVERVIERVGRVDTMQAPSSRPMHEDVPNETTKLIAERLEARGWTDPMRELHAAGIHTGAFGAVALRYDAPTKHVLRLEHHTCDGSIHFHVQDASSDGGDFVIYADGKEMLVVDMIVAFQDVVTLANLEEHVRALMKEFRVCIERDGDIVDVKSSA